MLHCHSRDPLLDVPDAGVPRIPAGFTQPIYVELCVPYGQAPGNYSGAFDVTSAAGRLFRGPVAVEVWPVDLPRLDDAHAFRTAFNFNSNMSSWYPQGTEPATWWSDWFSFLAKHRLSGDSLYLDAPRPVEEYQHLASSGAPRMNVRGDWAATWDPAAIEQLRPTVTALKELGLGDRLYSYGFDEWPQLQNASVYSVFGALKKEWPWLKTMATLNWDDMPADLPLDVWVDGYGGDYGSSNSYLLPTPKEKLRQESELGTSSPGSLPGHRRCFYVFCNCFLLFFDDKNI